MAWISVHESIDGPKLRSFYKKLKCSKFEAVGILNFLWLWGLNNATKEGYIPSADEDDIGRYLYGKGNGSSLDSKDIVNALLDSGYIERHEDGLYIHDWDSWQKAWYTYQERKENDVNRKRRKKLREMGVEIPEELQQKKVRNLQLDIGEPEENKPQPSEESKPKKVKKTYSNDFEEFWSIYPNHKDKGQASKCFEARVKQGWNPEDLKQAARNYAAECRKYGTEPRFIKHGATFLSVNTPFKDYLPNDQTIESNPEEMEEPDMSNPFK